MSWIVQGFPRTKVQALSLQKMSVIPDKFVYLNTDKQTSLARVKTKLMSINTSLHGLELEEIASQCLSEHELNQRGVNSIFNQFIFELDCDQFSAQQEVQNEILRIMKLRYKSDAPRRPPRIVILGPPGSGRTT
jgi:adenylate kinase family enzyme